MGTFQLGLGISKAIRLFEEQREVTAMLSRTQATHSIMLHESLIHGATLGDSVRSNALYGPYAPRRATISNPSLSAP